MRTFSISMVALLGALAAPGVTADPAASSSLPWIFDGAVQAVARQGDTLYVGGTFTAVAPSSTVLPPAYLLSEGTGAVVAPALPALTGPVRAALPDDAGGYYLAGEFTVPGPPVRSGVVHVLADGSIDPAFIADVGTSVGAMTRIGTSLFLSGTFTGHTSVIAVSAVDGSRLSWQLPSDVGALLFQTLLPAVDRLIAIGEFVLPGERSGVVAAYDAATGALLWRTLVAPGGVRAPRSAWTGVTDATSVYVAHSPTSTNGGLSRVALATGAIDPAWNPQVSPAALALGGGTLYVGGAFTSVAGLPRSWVGAIDAASAALLPWAPVVPPGVTHLVVGASGAIYASSGADSSGVTKRSLTKIDPSGAVTTWTTPVRPERLDVFVAGAPGTLLVASNPTSTAFVPRFRLAAFDLPSGALLPWNPGAGGTVETLAISGQRVTVAGRFNDLAGQQAFGAGVVDATTGAFVPWAPLQPGVPAFADDRWFYWAWQPLYFGPLTLQRYALATGDVDPGWRRYFAPATFTATAFDATTLYLSDAGGLVAVDRRTAATRWSLPGVEASTLAVSGDTLYLTTSAFSATVDARTGAPIAGAPASSTRAAVVADARLVTSEFLFTGRVARQLHSRRLDGSAAPWSLTFDDGLTNAPRDLLAVAGDRLVAGGVLGTRTPVAAQGVAVFTLDGPRAPAALRARPRGRETEFTWDPPAVPPAQGYVFEARAAAGGPLLAAVPVSGTSVRVVVPPATFYVQVRLNAGPAAAAETSNVIRVQGGCRAAPLPPAALRASISGSVVSIAWTAPDELVSTYTLVAGSAPGRADLATLPLDGAETSFVANAPAGTYHLRVRAANACGASVFTPDLPVTVGGHEVTPAAPSNLRAAVAGTVVTFTWDAPAGPVSGYVLEAGTDLGLADLVPALTLGAGPRLVVPGVPAGQYVIRVRARNAAGYGPPSADLVVGVPDLAPLTTRVPPR